MMQELYNIHTKFAATDATKKGWSIHLGTCCILQMTDLVSNDTYISDFGVMESSNIIKEGWKQHLFANFSPLPKSEHPW